MNRGVGTEREGGDGERGWGRRETVGRGTERLRNSNSKSLFYKNNSCKIKISSSGSSV